jgi:uncharacterized protein involved in exopolysaccharide biosynthesis
MHVPLRSGSPDGESPAVSLRQRDYAIERPASSSLGSPRPPQPDDDGPMFDIASLRLAAGFPVRALRRRRSLAALLFGSLLALVALAIFAAPKHYVIETVFSAEKNFVMPALGNPKRVIPGESDSPTRLASETVMKRANLLKIIEQTQLMSTYEALQSPLRKVYNAVTSLVGAPATESDKLDALLGLLEKRLFVNTAEGVITIGIDWPDPDYGFRLVEAAQQNFFEQRHASEVSLIGESIGILEGHVAESQRAIQSALDEINAAMPKRAPIKLPVATVTRPAAGSGAASPAVLALQSELRTKQQTIADLTSSRSQRLAALQQNLSELRGRYGSAHPDIRAANENIAALSQPSPQLAELRAEEAALRARLTALGATASSAATGVTSSSSSLEPTLAREAIERLSRINADSQEAPEITFAKSRLKIATGDYEEFLDRLEGARIELETARAAFKYRYSIISPARVPKKSSNMSLPLLVLGGMLFAALATVFAAVMLDIGGGKLVEPWQVERQLGVPVLAEVQRR